MDAWIEAWRAWIAGDHVGNMVLWGITITGWGRLGMALEFASAWVIVADIVGPDPIRAFGVSMRAQLSRSSPRVIIDGTMEWAKALVAWLRAKTGSDDEAINMTTMERYRADGVNVLVTILLTVAVAVFVVVRLDLLAWVTSPLGTLVLVAVVMIGSLFVLGVLFFTLAPLVTIALVGVVAILALAISGPILGLAAVLDRPEPERALKIVSLGVFVFGFQLDLLAN